MAFCKGLKFRWLLGAFLQGNFVRLEFGISFENALYVYLSLKNCTARPLLLSYRTCSIGLFPKKFNRNRIWEKRHFSLNCVFITITHSKRTSE